MPDKDDGFFVRLDGSVDTKWSLAHQDRHTSSLEVGLGMVAFEET